MVTSGVEEDRLPPDPHPCNPCPSLCQGSPGRSLVNRDPHTAGPRLCRSWREAGVQLAGLGHPQGSLDLGGWKQLAAI